MRLITKNIQKQLDLVLFEQAKKIITVETIKKDFSKQLLFFRYGIFGLTILIEISIAVIFSGTVFTQPLFAILEWLIVFFTGREFLKICIKKLSNQYLTRFYSCYLIMLSIISVILSISTCFIFLAFSGSKSVTFIFQIIVQTIFSTLFLLIVETCIYKYLQGRIFEELKQFEGEFRKSLFVKIVEKSIFSGILLVIIGMQYYRMNKFWIEHTTSWFTTIVVPIVQLILFGIVFIVILLCPIIVFYPKFVYNFLLEKYSEQFRESYEFEKKDWYDG